MNVNNKNNSYKMKSHAMFFKKDKLEVSVISFFVS